MSNLSHAAAGLRTEQEAAQRLNVAVATLQRWRWAGKGPAYVKIGALVRYPDPDIEAFIHAGRVEPKSAA